MLPQTNTGKKDDLEKPPMELKPPLVEVPLTTPVYTLDQLPAKPDSAPQRKPKHNDLAWSMFIIGCFLLATGGVAVGVCTVFWIVPTINEAAKPWEMKCVSCLEKFKYTWEESKLLRDTPCCISSVREFELMFQRFYVEALVTDLRRTKTTPLPPAPKATPPPTPRPLIMRSEYYVNTMAFNVLPPTNCPQHATCCTNCSLNYDGIYMYQLNNTKDGLFNAVYEDNHIAVQRVPPEGVTFGIARLHAKANITQNSDDFTFRVMDYDRNCTKPVARPNSILVNSYGLYRYSIKLYIPANCTGAIELLGDYPGRNTFILAVHEVLGGRSQYIKMYFGVVAIPRGMTIYVHGDIRLKYVEFNLYISGTTELSLCDRFIE